MKRFVVEEILERLWDASLLRIWTPLIGISGQGVPKDQKMIL